MEAVRIMCQLSEEQISKMVDFVASHLPINLFDLEDIDQIMLMDSVRICVDFDVNTLGKLKVLSAELLNRDWDVLETDSFAFSQYLKPLIDEYNRASTEAGLQGKQIINDQKTFQAL